MARFWKVVWIWMMLGMLTLAFGAIGNVALVVGEANILRANTTLVVENGMALEEKDILTTAKNAKVQLRFSDDTIISLGSEAEFSIDTFINDDTAPKAKFGIARGSFGAITGKIGKIAPQDFALQTKTATIGIRGTHIRGRTGSTGDMVSCLRGSISVTSLSTGQSVAVLAGQITRIAPGMAPEPPRNIEPGDMEAMGDAPGGEGGEEGEGDAPGAGEGAGEEGDAPEPQDQEGDTPQEESTAPATTTETLVQTITQAAQEASNTSLDSTATDSLVNADIKQIYVMGAGEFSGATQFGYFYDGGKYMEVPSDGTSTFTTTSIGLYGESEPVSSWSIPFANTWDSFTYQEIVIEDGQSFTEALLFTGIPTASLPTSGIGAYEEIISYNSFNDGTPDPDVPLRVNFSNRHLLEISWDEDDLMNQEVFVATGRATTSGLNVDTTLYKGFDLATPVVSTYAGDYSGQFFGTTANYMAVVGVEQVGVGEEFEALAAQSNTAHFTAASEGSGTITLGGVATSLHGTSLSIADSFNLMIDKGTGATTAGSIIDLMGREGSATYSLVTDGTNNAYITKSYFAVQGFYGEGSLLFAVPAGETLNAPIDEYVSWGYWLVPEANSAVALPVMNEWVAGEVMTSASYIDDLIGDINTATTTYDYNGYVLGTVGTQGIDETNSDVAFSFDFGGGSASFDGNIELRPDDVTTWDLVPTGTSVTSGGFSAELAGTVGVNSITQNASNMEGRFYGNQAQAVGGSFQATDGTNNAKGVFKAVR